ncbi:hypothetical protein MTR_3g452180 [Medicago truncatula]|uniref:TF-B3 domain-containing protein n=2 Tax=Medicago truncatula TaxID=3880 RepID=A0A072UXG1_MEDTR|nr:hypothetical protein MTR_3g452180 [Medicago truncatula]
MNYTSGIYLTRGWCALRDFYKIKLGAWVTMVFVGNGRFEISLEDRVGDKIQSPIFNPPMNFVIDRSWLPFQMMDAVPTAYVHSDISFLYSYEKKLSATELDSGWMVLAFFGFCKLTLCKGTTSINLVDECGNKWMCTVVYGTRPYKHFKIGGGWKRMVDARGLGIGCIVKLGAPADGSNQKLYFKVIRH